VAKMGKTKNIYGILVRIHLENAISKIKKGWEYNIKMGLKKTGCEDEM
jgi:hypothetical protein